MIGLIGINHNTAPVEVRQQFALSAPEASSFVEGLVQAGHVLGAVVLSTCNRIEVYFEHEADNTSVSRTVANRLRTFKKVRDAIEPHLYDYHSRDAMSHLFRLASGLESMVIGETQILGQLKDAFRRANDNNQSTSTLSRLFHKAFETAKLIRTRFIVSSTPISAGATAVRMMDSLDGVSRDMPVLILGAGQMAEMIFEALTELGYTSISMYNRTRERAAKMASLHGIAYYCEGELCKALATSRLIYVATSSLTPIVSKNEMPTSNEDVFLFDMSVPCNIDPNVKELSYAKVFTIDDLKENGNTETSLDFDQIERCIQLKVDEFAAWVEASQLRQIIGRVQEVSKIILQKELSFLSPLLQPQVRSVIEEHNEHFRITASTAIVTALKDITDGGRNMKYADAINALCQAIEEKER